jgi:hypothetical protein
MKLARTDCWARENNYNYIRLDFDKHFTTECFEEFVSRMAACKKTSMQLKIFGPESLMLYYLAPQKFNREEQ